MIALDTNVLVRVFVQDKDSDAQSLLVRNLLSKEKYVYIPTVVQVELVWVLKSAYGYDKSSIVRVLEILDEKDAFHLENPNEFSHVLQLYKDNNADFSDYLIVAHCQTQHANLWTFDKKLSKVDNAFKLSNDLPD